MATVTDPELEEPETSIVEPSELYEVVDGRIVAEHYEVVDGIVVEEPPLGAQSGWFASFLAQTMGYFATSNRLGRVVTEVLFVLEAEPRLRRRPDIALVSRERWPLNRQVPPAAAWDVVPDLAVEIISPSDIAFDIMSKLEEYFRAGVRLVWVVYPEHRKVYAYDSPTIVRILQAGDELDGGAVLPGFRFPLAGLFETQEDGPTPVA